MAFTLSEPSGGEILHHRSSITYIVLAADDERGLLGGLPVAAAAAAPAVHAAAVHPAGRVEAAETQIISGEMIERDSSLRKAT